ncbi:MAG: hypothetical protein RLO54_37085 [Sandaracinaceae bacterium]
MMDPIEDVRQRARVLHRQAARGEPEALTRLRALPELKALDDEALAREVRRRHALATLARELGFRGWPGARAALLGGGPSEAHDLGTVMHRDQGGAYFNIWSAHHEEARRIRAEHGGYLLAYRHQFLVVEGAYLEGLGLDPQDPDWDRMGRDWARPADHAAWRRITSAAIAAKLGPAR